MRTNVRIGNDIKLMWQILEGGVPVNLTNATDIKVLIAQGGIPSCNQIEITTFEVTDAVNGMIAVEVQKEVITELGYLWTVLEYTVPDSGMIDGNRKVTVDNVPVRIVAVTAEASQDSEFTVSSDIQAGFQGKSAYEVWLVENPDKTLQDYFDWLQQPATDVAEDVSQAETLRVQAENIRLANEQERVTAEQARIDAENIRTSNEVDRVDTENIRVANEQDRINAETLRDGAEQQRLLDEATRVSNEETRIANESGRVTAEQGRVDAEIIREQQEADRQTNTAQAIADAEEATLNADTAAQNANDARDNIMPSVLNNEEVQADVYAQLNARITALEAILTNKIKDRVDVTKEFNVWGKTNLILYGDGASTKTPDFIGQTYIDTTNGNVYIAVGVSNAGNWKLV